MNESRVLERGDATSLPSEKQLSYSGAGPDSPLLECTIGDLLDSTAQAYPLQAAVVSRHQNQTLTYGEFAERVQHIAQGFISLGIIKGERIALWAVNSVEWLIVQYAAAKVGAILVAINPAYRASELAFILEKAECQTLVMSPSFKNFDQLETLRQAYRLPQTDRSASKTVLPSLRNIVLIGKAQHNDTVSWEELVQRGASVADNALLVRERSLVCEDVINVQFTSGTTGTPKGVLLSHRNLINNAVFAGQRMRFNSRDRLCLPVPFFHCFGMVLGSLAAVAHGAAMVLPGEHFDAGSVLEAIEQERCTVIYGVPTMFLRLREHPSFEGTDLQSLRAGNIGGAPCPVALVRTIMEEMHCPDITIGYGLTEASPLITLTSMTDPLDARLTSVGKGLPCTELKIVDPASNVTVLRGAVGEVCTRGYGVMKGYYKDPEATSEAIDPEGWLHTGDLGTLDGKGYCRIVGRIKDMIIRGGEKIYPREIEDLLGTCPEISEAYVVGIPDPEYGEEAAAWVKLVKGSTMSSKAIFQFCQGKIASYKIPRKIQLVKEFPLTANGKIQKHLIREMMGRETTSTSII